MTFRFGILPVLLFLLVGFPLFSSGEQELVLEGSRAVYGSTSIEAGMSYPPFVNASWIDFTIAEMKKLAINRMRTGMDWQTREPEPGQFNWGPMDLRMTRAAESHIKVFLTISSTCPPWARLATGKEGACIMDEDALRRFLEAVLRRYPGIDKIQFGNEWEFGSEEDTVYNDWYSVRKFVTYTNILYDAVQKISPDTQVVLGGLTVTWPIMEYFARKGLYPDLSGLELARGTTEEYLKSWIDRNWKEYEEKDIKEKVEWVLSHAQYDVLDIHLYDDPENWPEYLSVLPKNTPIVVSEFGGPNSRFENTSPAYHAARMTDYIDAIEELPIIEAYYFKLVQSPISYHKHTGLFYHNRTVKPARNVFASRLRPLAH